MKHSTDTPLGYQAPKLSDFSFFGFDGLMPLERNMRHVEIRGGDPRASVVEQPVYVPAEHSGRAGRQRKALARSLDGSGPAEVEPENEIDEEIIYLGWLYDHYGHFLMRSLARTWFLNQVDPSLRVVFHHPSRARWRPAGWAVQMLEAFGVPLERILTLNAPTRLRRLIVPEPLFEPRSEADDNTVRAHEAMAQPYRAVAAKIAGNATPSAQPVYLSRRLLSSSQRLIIGEWELEELLRQNGFRIAHLQTMTFQDQVHLINSHTDIFSNAGSAAQNVLFARHRPRLHLLTNGQHFSPDYFMHASLVGAPTTFINCLGTDGRPAFNWGQKLMPHILDAQTLLAYLDQSGFLTTPATARPATPHAEQQNQHAEAWLYGYVRVVGHRVALPAEVEREALGLALSSWPVSLALARYYAKADRGRADSLARQFVALVAVEHDPERLARYRAEVVEMAPVVARSSLPGTAQLMSAMVASRFLRDPVSMVKPCAC